MRHSLLYKTIFKNKSGAYCLVVIKEINKNIKVTQQEINMR